MTNYQEFRKLFESFNLKYKGYDLNMMISRGLYDIATKPKKGFYRSSLRLLFNKFDVQQLDLKNENKSILFYQGIGYRKDENLWCDYIQEQIDADSKPFYSKDIDKGVSFHPRVILRVFFAVMRSLKNSGLTFWQKCDIYTRVMPYCNTIHDLESIDLGWVKKYVAMLYPLSLGALFTQYFKKKGVETIALADGIYFDYGEDAPYDAVNYDDFISDQLLFWGDYSRREYVKIGLNGESLKVGGYPKDEQLQSVKTPNTFKKCCVLLARTPFDDSNMLLLNVLKQYSNEIKFSLKLHPSNDVCVYSKFAENHGFAMVDKNLTLDVCIGKEVFDFAIAVNTTAYYEALIKGLPCLRFRDDSHFLMMEGYADDFHTSEEFQERLNSIKNMPTIDYQKAISQMLQDAIGFGINNYHELILR